MSRKIRKRDQEILTREGVIAEKYLCSHMKISGPLKHIDDGKTDVLVQLPYPSLVRLLRDYGINRVADFYVDHKAEAK